MPDPFTTGLLIEAGKQLVKKVTANLTCQVCGKTENAILGNVNKLKHGCVVCTSCMAGPVCLACKKPYSSFG